MSEPFAIVVTIQAGDAAKDKTLRFSSWGEVKAFAERQIWLEPLPAEIHAEEPDA